MTAPERDVTGQPDPLAEVLAGVGRKHRAGGYWSAADGHRECFCGHVMAADESYEAHVVPIQAAAVREWLAGREAEVPTAATWFNGRELVAREDVRATLGVSER